MNGSQDPRQGYPENAAPQGVPPQYASGPPPSSAWNRPVSEIGVDARLLSDPRRKSPLLALILSAMPGLGQVYVGYYNQGFLNMVVCSGTIFLLNVTGRHYSMIDGRFMPVNNSAHALQPFLGFFLAFYWLYNMVDAYRRAAFYNQALAGLGPVAFPEELKLPKAQGSMVGGLALIVVGLVFFSNTALGLSLDWVEVWWPMALVLMGAWLIYKNVSDKRATPPPPAHPTEPAERACEIREFEGPRVRPSGFRTFGPSDFQTPDPHRVSWLPSPTSLPPPAPAARRAAGCHPRSS